MTLYRRDKPHKEGQQIRLENLGEQLPLILEEIQHNYYAQAKALQQQHIYDNIQSLEELKAFFTPKNPEKPEAHALCPRQVGVRTPKRKLCWKNLK